MGYPTVLSRTKNWSTEILTDTDLEGQLDLIISWANALADKSSGHKHDGTTSEGPKIATLASSCIVGATPTTDAGVANKEYVDDQIAAIPASLSFETGMILLWSGSIATIPSGWNICDGLNSTPDLSDKFVLGVKTSGTAAVGDTGGDTLSGTGTDIKWTGDSGHGSTKASGGDGDWYGAHTHTYSAPYYALAYIMKS